MDEFDAWWEGADIEPQQPMTEDQKWKIHELIDEVVLLDHEIDNIKLWFLNSPTFESANELISKLIDRLPHPVTERGSYNQTQLAKHINTIKDND